MTSIQPYYFTFGVRYRHELHPVFSTTDLPSGYVTVEAPSEDKARDLMRVICGEAWAFCYTDQPSSRFYPKGELQRYTWGIPEMPREPYGHSVTIGEHKVTSWAAHDEGDCRTNEAAVQVEFRDVQVMVYTSVIDGRVIVEATGNGDTEYRVVADDNDPVYLNYKRTR